MTRRAGKSRRRLAVRFSAASTLWATSSTSQGPLRISCMRPGNRTVERPRRTPSAVISMPRFARASATPTATAALPAWKAPDSGSATPSYDPPAVSISTTCRPTASSRMAYRTSTPASTRGLDRSRQASRITSDACGGWAADTVQAPSFTIPAFSRAISAIVSPRRSVWSSPMGVIAQAIGWITLVESSRPPRPHSTTARSTRRSLKYTKARAVSISKNEPMPSGRSRVPSMSGRARSVNPANARSVMGSPSTWMRSRSDTRWGDVYRPTR